jgi:ribosomal protein S7
MEIRPDTQGFHYGMKNLDLFRSQAQRKAPWPKNLLDEIIAAYNEEGGALKRKKIRTEWQKLTRLSHISVSSEIRNGFLTLS